MFPDLIVTEAERYNDSVSNLVGSESVSCDSASGEEAATQAKAPRLVDKYNRHHQRQSTMLGLAVDTARKQLSRYIDEVQNSPVAPNDVLFFWERLSQKLPALYTLACRALSVPASSAPVERVFSRGGILMRPHRARLSADMLSMLMFLKCNEHVV